MSADDTTDDDESEYEEFDGDGGNVRERLEEEADRAVDQLDEGIVDLLSWVLETETRTRIYVYLRQHPDSTSDEIADGTGLYPSTVREALAELHDEGKVSRQKRESDGAGNNPYEYSAMAPSELVGTIVDDVQSELNTVFNLDDVLGAGDDEPVHDEEPVTITVEDAADDEAADADGDEHGGTGDGDEAADASDGDDEDEDDT
jgi:predicted transcriptional regulator